MSWRRNRLICQRVGRESRVYHQTRWVYPLHRCACPRMCLRSANWGIRLCSITGMTLLIPFLLSSLLVKKRFLTLIRQCQIYWFFLQTFMIHFNWKVLILYSRVQWMDVLFLISCCSAQASSHMFTHVWASQGSTRSFLFFFFIESEQRWGDLIQSNLFFLKYQRAHKCFLLSGSAPARVYVEIAAWFVQLSAYGCAWKTTKVSS